MLVSNLRHLRVFLSVARFGSVTQAAEQGFVSQPAVTQALAKLEADANTALFSRTPQGLFLTDAGRLFRDRVTRALGRLDAAMQEIAPRLVVTATRAQLVALINMVEAQNFTLAARRLGIAQPTIHRAITTIEASVDRPLFQRSLTGVVPTRQALALALSAQLAFAELDQAVAELAELQDREVGEIVIGAMPLSRSHILPNALGRFRSKRPKQAIRIVDGVYEDLLAGLRRAEIDLLIGALRDPLPVVDVVQEKLFDDVLAIIAGPKDPLLRGSAPELSALRERPWLVPRRGTPTRAQFEALFENAGLATPESIIETGSVILMREMVENGLHLGCISHAQALREIERGIVCELPFPGPHQLRPIGLTFRKDWHPTPAQNAILEAIRETS